MEKFNEYDMYWYINSDSENIIKQNRFDSNKHTFKSQVPRDEALKLMTESLHCLVSVGNLNPNQIPSKVIEYVATGKPVIHFAEISDDPVFEISKEFSNLFVITKNTNIRNLKKELNNYFSEIKNFDSKKFENLYSPNSLVKKLNIF